MMTATKPNAYTLKAARKLLKLSQPQMSVLSRQHDFETSGPVLERYVPDDIIGLGEEKRTVFLTAESVERYQRKQEKRAKESR